MNQKHHFDESKAHEDVSAWTCPPFCNFIMWVYTFPKTLWAVCTKVDPTLIADQRNFKAKYLQNDEES